MGFAKEFFMKLGFDFELNLKSKKIFIENNSDLNKKLINCIFFYDSPNQTNTSFYFINQTLSKEELRQVRKYIWNENKSDLLFYIRNDSLTKLILQYAKVSPNISDDHYELDSFNISIEEQERLDKIQRWKFDSGLFWTNYQEFLAKSKKFKSIDKELVGTLEALKNQLNGAFSLVSENVDKREEYVQALIDRTLYIKYLEDNHIINSYFYEHHFNDSEVDYKKLLLNTDSVGLNRLFEIIHNIFNNELFEKPTIPKKYLNSTICGLIQDSLNHNIEVGQLRLFDFRFDIIPVEFISYIYEIFLTDKQKENGIYYTPKKLTQLIVDDVIPENEIGSVLDPSCGSGMFLITAFQRLLENSQEDELKDIAKRIEFRAKLIKDNIFGIEKELTAQRFTLFSLSLQLFRGLEKTQVSDFIAKQLKENGKVEFFKKYSFFSNIQHANSLEVDTDKIPHKDKTFDYIVGNPPFTTKNVSSDTRTFVKEYKTKLNKEIVKAESIVGNLQISQCFFLKIKDWSNIKTKYGFVSNSSNFYNPNSRKFQKFFYSEYSINKLYELSRVKKILFENAVESVVSLIFSNSSNSDNIIDYYLVDEGLFSKKPFELLIIQEDKIRKIAQKDLLNGNTNLRDYLIGNNFDLELSNKLNSNCILDDYLRKVSSYRGFEIWGENARKKEFELSNEKWKQLSDLDKQNYLNKFISKYFSNTKDSIYNKPYIKPKNLKPFLINTPGRYISSIVNFHRPRPDDVYLGKKLLLRRIGSQLNCVYSNQEDYFDFSVYTVKLLKENYYYLFCALLNSQVVQFFLDFYLRKRLLDSFSRIGVDDIKNVPIPRELKNDIAIKVSNISKELSDGNYEYNDEVAEKLNELIFDLYDLSYLERQRIKDYFINKKVVTRSINEIGDYIETLRSSIGIFLKTSVTFESEHNRGVGLLTVKINLNDISNTPSVKKTGLYLLNEIFKQNPQENFLATREKIWGKDCVYIVKQDINVNWSKTKAFEDGQEVLRKLMN
nr:N-6 DNA methylase [uncultured Psychroserpens sp.]